MGRTAFWREVMVTSPPSAPWGGQSVNYIQLSLCTVKTRAGWRSPPTSLPSSSPLRSWDIPILPGHRQGTYLRENGLPTCGDAIFHFIISYTFLISLLTLCFSSATLTQWSYVLGHSPALCWRGKESRVWREHWKWTWMHLSQIESVRTAWMEVRAEQDTEMAGRLCFITCQVRIHCPLAILFLISPLMCCEALPACLPGCNAQQSPK